MRVRRTCETCVTCLSTLRVPVMLGAAMLATARLRGFETREKPNRWKAPGSEPSESQSEPWSLESEKPGGGAR